MLATNKKYKCVVVGAGSAGLQCARTLQSDFGIPASQVLVLEARSTVGGRVQQTDTFIPGHKVELGAEFVHGCTTRINEMAEFYGWQLDECFTWAHGDGGPDEEPAPDGGIGLYYLGKEKKLLSYDTKDPDFVYLSKVLDSMAETDPSINNEPAMSIERYLIKCNVSPRMIGLADAGYANTCGGSLARISYDYQCASEKHWLADGEGDYRIRGSYGHMVDVLVDPHGPHSANPMKKHRGKVEDPLQIKTSTPVTHIAWDNPDGLVYLTTPSGQVIQAECAVVTVPLPILKNPDYLSWSPPLPRSKQSAARKIGIGVAVKILMRFKSRGTVPANLHGMICADCFVPEMWFRMTPNGDMLLTCFMMDNYARHAASMGEEAAIQLALNQLDEIFPGDIPTSQHFIQGELHDWGSVPYVHVGYTHCVVGEDESVYRELAKPMPNGRVMFAGEAYVSEGANMTVHSALDAGFRAAGEVASFLGLSQGQAQRWVSRL